MTTTTLLVISPAETSSHPNNVGIPNALGPHLISRSKNRTKKRKKNRVNHTIERDKNGSSSCLRLSTQAKERLSKRKFPPFLAAGSKVFYIIFQSNNCGKLHTRIASRIKPK
ncbi:hypothetical protein TNCT_722751 [Trichonephila clavata]|uniref:Uncharacterized protein n=1 Tax=Trichonephila clavata TaxID=2740835 RepID=A0A8X6GLP5_TRICU|nr:hypothetical protein TNCT_722751 [Trichonephila clavata]